MLYGIYTSGLAALGQSVRLDIIANNLANVGTPSFRRDQITFQERMVEALEDRPDLRYYNSAVDRHGGAPFIGRVVFDRQPGGYEMTGRPLDLAIEGDGFFTLRELGTTDRISYTRAGNFLFNADGTLVTADGKYEVLDGTARPIRVREGSPPDFVVDSDGTVYQAGEALATLDVTDFDDYSRLVKQGGMRYLDGGAGAQEARGFRVNQGFLEGSSVNPIQEMVDMIKAMRVLESNLQMIRMQDASLDRLVNDFGRLQR